MLFTLKTDLHEHVKKKKKQLWDKELFSASFDKMVLKEHMNELEKVKADFSSPWPSYGGLERSRLLFQYE